MKKKVMQIILDGFGVRSQKKGNAVKLSKMPFYDSLVKTYPHTLLGAHGKYVGLPDGFMGNSEVGHLTLGSGRIIMQDMTLINKKIKDKSFFSTPVFNQFFKRKNKTTHIIGLGSEAGIHSHLSHMVAVIEIAFKHKNDVLIHFFSDGRDSEPKVAQRYIKKLNLAISKLELKYTNKANISTLLGRYYSMDRNKNLDRTKVAFDLIVNGESKYIYENNTALLKLVDLQHKTLGDEFLLPSKLYGYDGVQKDDKFIFTNFREDRMRQIVGMFLKKYDSKNILTMSLYDDDFKSKVILKRHKIQNNLASVLSKHNKSQYHIAETEKYAHVTYFFNSGVEKPYKLEDNKIVQSPKVATYDLKPEMNAKDITLNLLKNASKYDFVVVNFANPDMVGHTGNINAAIESLEFTDDCLKKIIEKYQDEFTFFICADHGNCEEMIGKYERSHTLNPIRLIVTDKDIKLKQVKNQGLSNIAPSILKYINIKIPKEMNKPLF